VNNIWYLIAGVFIGGISTMILMSMMYAASKLMIYYLETNNMMKTKLVELELMKQSYLKKLNQIENKINQIKGDNTYEQEITGIYRPSKRM
jgi:hypothetical protein